MYGIFTYIWLIFVVNVGKYASPMDPDPMGKVDNPTIPIFVEAGMSSDPKRHNFIGQPLVSSGALHFS